VFFLNSNGMDIKIDQADDGRQYLEYNTIGGVLDFYFLAGPTPKEVAKQYSEVVGLPAMQAYWTFGVCSKKPWEFKTGLTLDFSSVPQLPLWISGCL
jgi:alpha-glucosidase (family GH31 glycosyl hydrolase)